MGVGESVRSQANLGGAHSQPLDDIDRTILEALQDNGHLSHAELSRMVGLAVSSVNERIRKLVQRGVIAGWNARLSPSALGLDLLAFVYVLIDRPENSPAFLELVAQLPEVQECHHIAADWNFLLKVRVRNTAAFEALLTTRLKSVPGVVRTQTVITLTSHKDTPSLPLRG
jgi:Lrp/AsnC family leucine-responsive transcriptional regulator